MWKVAVKSKLPGNGDLLRVGRRGFKLDIGESRDSVRRILRATGAQAKLAINTSGDEYEQEADRVADQVMRMPVGGQEEYQKHTLPISSGARDVQSKSYTEAGQMKVLDSVRRTIESPGGGSPLNEAVRSRVEPVLGADLSSVRVHSGRAAREASENINAKAFTHQKNIFLGRGQSASDIRLMAHEAVHVVQQSNHLVSDKYAASLDNDVRRVHLIQRTTEGDACGVSNPRWVEFAIGFNDKFQSILHAFAENRSAGEGESTCSTDTSPRQVGPGHQSWETLAPEELSSLFSVQQRDKLINFFNTNIIPDRLFNGDDVGGTSAQQRILMAGVILSEGVYQPGSFLQQVQSRMCGHFVKLTWHYAGVTPSGNAEWAGVSGNLDHDGNILIGNGRQESVYSGLGSNRTYMRDLSEEEMGDYVPEGTNFAEAYNNASEERQNAFHRNRAMPFDDFHLLQAGDWLYYFNANRSASGDHSVVFSRWSSDVQRWPSGEPEVDGIRYRQAVVFSGSTRRVGREHTVNLGESFRASDPKICPITKVSRVSPDAQPADSVADVLGGSVSEGEGLSRANRTYMRRFRRRHGAEMDLNLLSQSLRAENTQMIDELVALNREPDDPDTDRSGRERLTQEQQTLLLAANREEHVENLVRLTQRLRALTNNARVHDANRERLYVTGRAAVPGRRRAVAGLNEQYETSHHETEERVAAMQEEINRIDGEMAPAQAEITRIEGQIDELAQTTELRRIRDRLNETWTQVRRLPPRTLERNALMDERRQLRTRKREIQGEVRGNSRDITALRRELRPFKNRVRPLERRRARLERDIASARASDPRGHAHPGNIRSGVDLTSRFNGNIESVRPYVDSGGLAVRESRME